MLVLGLVAGVGFTVALFVTTVAMQLVSLPSSTEDMLKLGALLSFAAGPLAYLLAKALGVQRMENVPASSAPAESSA